MMMKINSFGVQKRLLDKENKFMFGELLMFGVLLMI